MAGNFWQSSHFQEWLLDKDDLLKERHADLQHLTPDEYQKVLLFYSNFVQHIGEQLKVRQQVIATSIVYMRRFYARNSLGNIDPLLMAPTCVFLASKVEEFGVLVNNRLTNACTTVIKTKYNFLIGHHQQQEFPYRIQHISEAEFYLLEAMDCCLVVYLPYRSLIVYHIDMKGNNELMQAAWKITNDLLKTDLILLYPPFQIALAALYLACSVTGFEATHWFVEINVNLDSVIEITKEMIKLYEMWKKFDEKLEIPHLLQKSPKPCTTPRDPDSQLNNQIGIQMGGQLAPMSAAMGTQVNNQIGNVNQISAGLGQMCQMVGANQMNNQLTAQMVSMGHLGNPMSGQLGNQLNGTLSNQLGQMGGQMTTNLSSQLNGQVTNQMGQSVLPPEQIMQQVAASQGQFMGLR